MLYPRCCVCSHNSLLYFLFHIKKFVLSEILFGKLTLHVQCYMRKHLIRSGHPNVACNQGSGVIRTELPTAEPQL